MVYDYKTLEKALVHWNAKSDAASDMIDEMLEVMDKFAECENCEEIYYAKDLLDTEGAINGNVGKVCEQCWEDLDIDVLPPEEAEVFDR